ncbi:Mcm22p [Lachancea thermotolerans CBS 6340]|uniref:KLTH0D17622p n=1 Tax=Lachancea thermotolerans (strain ATCC 56472 / CBS 6340 / NRRL Y-8284) TaxID=559295 RepID=C5DFS9_LACTC|nr:KLTH0D17622p [Lachancea thermotolerans CBS 6340]CAR23034.1 KLTH0D17622p [Lachancea thermotolerans CBS 6340]
MDNDNQLSIYVGSVEREIENKGYFLKQVLDAIEVLKLKRHADTEESHGSWHEFSRKVMFTSERSDPIGLCLAFCEERLRLKTSKEYLTMEPLDALKEALKFQKSLNRGLESFMELMKVRNKGSGPVFDQETGDLTKHQNSVLWRKLQIFVENFLAIDTSSESTEADIVAGKIFEVLSHLIKGQKAVQKDCVQQQLPGFYRLLIKTKCTYTDNEGCVRLIFHESAL